MSSILHQDDAALWLLMKQGKEDAFEAIYRKYVGDLLHYGERMGMGEDVLKDLIQDLFVEIWRSRERIAETDSAKFYLFKALRYKMIRHNQQAMSALPLNGEWIPSEESVESRILTEEQEYLTARHLHEAIGKLPKRQQEIIHLRFFQGFSNQEIASLMNLQYQSATNLIHRSLQRIRQYFREPMLPFFLLAFLWF
ncbi:RNA polymerase sigma factor [Dinghuibacter silviterrae]|uniref:RNA polymerase sigma-70 factor (ECF subfamily) n=1 Tax=Dinghuibacter silviterrae TaxID=1539049 RepID=A0A4R8DGE4_9BACT|nr:sigma-70 family RNA polymerase sigma factor [Dinghuibacter silviterrae]TDW96030.1 RNA polymerase sigma-70 factor (ECF subfamily) [Dinghuibacter silviterrae]